MGESLISNESVPCANDRLLLGELLVFVDPGLRAALPPERSNKPRGGLRLRRVRLLHR